MSSPYCSDCPDREACMQNAPCSLVRQVADVASDDDWWTSKDAERAREDRQRALLSRCGPVRRWLCNHGHHKLSQPDWPLGTRWCLRCQARWPR